MQMRIKTIPSFLVILLLLALLVASGCSNGKQEAPDVTSKQQEMTEPIQSIEIDTPRGSLFMPEIWKDDLKTVVEDDGAVVHFIAVLDGREFPLFDVLLSDSAENSEGKICDSDGNTWNVAVELSELEDIASLPEEQQDQLYAMQEDVNYLIAQMNA